MFANADAYERYMGRWSRRLAPLFAEFALVPDRGRILDVGSGTGSLTVELARRNPGVRVTGIDRSSEYVEYANGRNEFPDRASFQVADAQELPFPDKSFDATVSLLVLCFVPDPSRAAREMRRVTKPGGTVSAAIWDYGDGMGMLRTFWDAARITDERAATLDENHLPLCRGGELSTRWEQSGLEQVDEQALTIEMRFESFADYWDPFLLGQGPAGAYVHRLDRDRREALRGELKRRLNLSSEEQPLELTARAWAVRGTVPNHR